MSVRRRRLSLWGAASNRALDGISNIAAVYSLRMLVPSYSGPLIRVRRNQDNEEIDVYARPNGVIDSAAITSFLNSSSPVSTTAFVVKWYDQSGNAFDISQSSASAQSTILSTTLNSKQVLTFDGSDYLQGTAAGLLDIAESEHSIFFVVVPNNDALNKTVISWQKFGDTTNTDQERYQFNNSEQLIYHDGLAAHIVDAASYSGTAALVTGTHSTTTVTTRINGALGDTNPTIADALPAGIEAFTIGQEFDGASPGTPSDFFLGNMAEIIILSAVASAGTISTIEANMAAYYGITLP